MPGKGFICLKLKKYPEKLRDFRPTILKECFCLYVTGTVPVPSGRHFYWCFSSFFALLYGKQMRTGEGETSPTSFFEKLKKIASIDKILIQNAILRVSGSQNSEIFPCVASVLCVVIQICIEMH